MRRRSALAAIGALPAALFARPPNARSVAQAAWAEAGARLLQTVEAELKEGRPTIVIPPGDYMFTAAGFDFVLRDLSDVILEAAGATFWFPRMRGGVHLETCRRVTVRGLTLDQIERPFIQGRIREIRPDRKEIVADAEPGYPGRADLRDPNESLRCIFYEADGSRELDVRDCNAQMTSDTTADTLVIRPSRVFSESRERPLRPGDRFTLALRGGGGGIRLSNCGDCSIENLTIHSSAGFAIVETDRSPGGNVYRNCRIVRRPGRDDLLVGAADGFHSMLQRQGPTLDGCEFAWTADDLVNIHGFFQMVVEPMSPTELVTGGPFVRDFDVGSELSFYRLPNATPLGEARITACRELNDPDLVRRLRAFPDTIEAERKIRVRSFPTPEPCRVTLDRPIALQPFDLVQCKDYSSAGAVIRNGYFHDGHVRGLLVKSEGALLEGNRIERIARSGIVVKAEWYWLEGPFVDRIRIEANRLVDCAWQSFAPEGFFPEFAPITVTANFSRHLSDSFITPERQFGEIRIAGTTIVNSPGPAVAIQNARRVVLNDNRFEGVCAKTFALPGLDLTKRIDPLAPPPDLDGAKGLLERPRAAVILNSTGEVDLRGNRLTGESGLSIAGFGVGCDAGAAGTVIESDS